MMQTLVLVEIMGRPEGWGRDQGREVYQRLLKSVEGNPGVSKFKISMKGVQRIDISFSSETLVELAKRFRKLKGFFLTDLTNQDLIENLDAAAKKKEQPIMLWHDDSSPQLIGPEPSEGTREAFDFALKRGQSRASEFATHKGISIANASMKFKQLWEQGFLMRHENSAESGGVEYAYQCIG